jgi:hypothetical protein
MSSCTDSPVTLYASSTDSSRASSPVSLWVNEMINPEQVEHEQARQARESWARQDLTARRAMQGYHKRKRELIEPMRAVNKVVVEYSDAPAKMTFNEVILEDDEVFEADNINMERKKEAIRYEKAYTAAQRKQAKIDKIEDLAAIRDLKRRKAEALKNQ